jgi:hypothetical protein
MSGGHSNFVTFLLRTEISNCAKAKTILALVCVEEIQIQLQNLYT